jgi:hypothetical protein
MFTVLLVVLGIVAVWALAAVAVAFLAGGVIHARDHEDAPYGGFRSPRTITPTRVADLAPVRLRH